MNRRWVLIVSIVLSGTILKQGKAEPTLPDAAETPFQLHGGTENIAASSDDAAVKGLPVKDPPRPREPKAIAPKARPSVEDISAQISTASETPPHPPDSTPPNSLPPTPSSMETVETAADDVIPAAIPVPDDQVATSPTSPMGTVAFGAEAVARLGTDIAAVAQAYGKEPEQLTRLLLSDKNLKVDQGNSLVYACSRPQPSTSVVADIAADASNNHHHHHHRKLAQYNADAADPLPSTLAQSSTGVPLLHSRPSATRKIYLDFDGHTTTGEGDAELRYCTYCQEVGS